MLKIIHRVNDIEALKKIPPEQGVELDIHAYADQLVVHHDPFQKGVPLDEWLKHYKHAFAIFNIKEEGIEARVHELAAAHKVKDYFLLDVSAPVLFKTTQAGEKRVAVRISEYEPAATAMKYAGKAAWAFIDLYTEAFPIGRNEYQALRSAGYKLCLVSPELWGRDEEVVQDLRDYLAEHHYAMDAVLTKKPQWW